MFRILKKNSSAGRVTLARPLEGPQAPSGFLGAPKIDKNQCTGCGLCVKSCPTQALSIRDEVAENRRTLFLSYGDCVFCALCRSICPYQAVTFDGKFDLAAKRKEELTLSFPFSLSGVKADPAFVSAPARAKSRKPCDEQGEDRNDLSSLLSLDEVGPKLRVKIQSLFGRSLHVREVDAGSCNGCEIEMTNLSNPIYDVERFGIHFVASPRHADLLLVTGPITRQMELALAKTYAAMAGPKWVVACGSCAIGGGIFENSYAVLGGADKLVPVDGYVPGCPPRPEAILHGIFVTLDRVVREKK